MPEPTCKPGVPAKWVESLNRSKAQIASAQTAPLLPVLDRLRTSAKRLEAEMPSTYLREAFADQNTSEPFETW